MKKLLFVFFSLVCFSQLICSDINWTFPPTTLSTPGTNAAEPHVAVDANGNSVAIWIENGVVKSKYRLISGNWGSVSTLSGSSASSPRIVQDSNGNAAAVWLEGTVVKAATKLFMQTWSNVVTLSSSGAANPCLAVDVAGNVIAAWARNGNIETFTKIFGNNWTNTGSINSPGNPTAFPSIAIGGVGASARAFIVWHSTVSALNTVYTSTKLVSSGTWSTPAVLSDTMHQAAYARVAADKNGNATAIWYSYNLTGSIYSSVLVQSASRPSGGSWSPPASISAAGMRNPATLASQIAYDGMGNAVALWSTSFDDEAFTLQSAIRPTYGNWSQPQTVVHSLYSNQTDLSVCSLGDALALYLFYNGNALQILSSELDITGFMDSIWSVPLTISTGTQNAFPSVAATLTGNVINSSGVWLVGNGINNSVVAATGTKTLVSPPTNLAVAQMANDFGVFTEYNNTLSWDASTDPQVIGYLVYRNGVFLQQVGSNVLEIVDDNRVQNGSVTYGVASVDSQNSHSPIINITFP